MIGWSGLLHKLATVSAYAASTTAAMCPSGGVAFLTWFDNVAFQYSNHAIAEDDPSSYNNYMHGTSVIPGSYDGFRASWEMTSDSGGAPRAIIGSAAYWSSNGVSPYLHSPST
jgi:hypothetical protein